MQDAKDSFDQQNIDIIIMGAGVDIKDRLAIIKYIFESHKPRTNQQMNKFLLKIKRI